MSLQPTPNTILIEITPEAFAGLATRDANGNRLSVEWGNLADQAILDRGDTLPVWVPTITVDYADNIVATVLHRMKHPSFTFNNKAGRGSKGCRCLDEAATWLAVLSKEGEL